MPVTFGSDRLVTTETKICDFQHKIGYNLACIADTPDTCTYYRGQQSLARGPNLARAFRPSGPRQIVSFNIKFGPENVPNDERLFSRWV